MWKICLLFLFWKVMHYLYGCLYQQCSVSIFIQAVLYSRPFLPWWNKLRYKYHHNLCLSNSLISWSTLAKQPEIFTENAKQAFEDCHLAHNNALKLWTALIFYLRYGYSFTVDKKNWKWQLAAVFCGWRSHYSSAGNETNTATSTTVAWVSSAIIIFLVIILFAYHVSLILTLFFILRALKNSSAGEAFPYREVRSLVLNTSVYNKSLIPICYLLRLLFPCKFILLLPCFSYLFW